MTFQHFFIDIVPVPYSIGLSFTGLLQGIIHFVSWYARRSLFRGVETFRRVDCRCHVNHSILPHRCCADHSMLPCHCANHCHCVDCFMLPQCHVVVILFSCQSFLSLTQNLHIFCHRPGFWHQVYTRKRCSVDCKFVFVFVSVSP